MTILNVVGYLMWAFFGGYFIGLAWRFVEGLLSGGRWSE